MKSKVKALFIVAFLILVAGSQELYAAGNCNCTHFVGLTISDYQWDALARNVKPGDRICFTSGVRTGIEFFNIKGTAANPVILTNMCDGQVTINAPIAWGNALAFTNCQYYVLDGSNNPNVEYGIEVRGGQAGVNNQQLSTNFEIHHVNVNNTGCTGMMGKTDPTCDPKTQRGNFVMRDIIFHHNKISTTGCEGFYIGNSHYDGGKSLTCAGVPTIVNEHDIIGVQVYNCILQDIGNDGIQVGSSKQATIHHNQVRNVGIKNNAAHQNLIQCGGGTHGAIVHDNICDTGKGYGLYDSGGGGTYYNNIVVNSLLGAVNLQDVALDFAPTGFRIFNNTFINCNDYGVLMYSENPDPTLYYNNIVVGQNQAGYKYVNYNNPAKNKWIEGNNIRTQDITTVKFVDAAGKDFSLLPTSTLAVDKGALTSVLNLANFSVTADYEGDQDKTGPNPRIYNTIVDIGAYEYAPATGAKAFAPANQIITLPTSSVTLTGSGTSPTGVTGYLWTKKSGGAAVLANETTPSLSVTGLVAGVYEFELKVSDLTTFAFATVQVTVNAAATNVNPVALAGGNQSITLPTNTITLLGKGTDVDGNIASYLWTKTGGPAAGVLTNANTKDLALSALVQGTYTFLLTVTDDKGAQGSQSATVTVNAAATNILPTVSAGVDKTIFLPATTTSFLATAGDADGNIATILWEKKSGGAAVLGPPTNALALNLSGLALGNYTFRCTVTDNKGGTAFSETHVKVLSANQAPIVDAGTSQSITLPTNSTTLPATASDPDGNIASYAWTKVSGPTATLAGNTTSTLTLTNLLQGTYVFGLTVTDNSLATSYDEVIVAVSVVAGAPNETPLAIAGGNFSFSLPTNSINLYGSGFDADGSIVSYVWTKLSGGNATLTNVNTPTVSISGLETGQYEFRLVVTDDKGATDDDISVVTVSALGTNIFPIASAGADKIVKLPQSSVLLQGSGSDDDGTITTYAWTTVSGAASTFSSATAPTTTVSGLIEGTYIFRLQVTDDKGATDLNDVVVRVVSSTNNLPPNVSAGADKQIFLPTNTATVNGSATDDGTIVGTTWAKLSGPSVTIANPSTLALSLSNLVQGDYSFQLSATDNNDATVFDIMRLSVLPASFTPPVVSAGDDQQIVLPINAVNLTGTATATNGVISTTKWTKTVGPAVTMTGDNTLSLACTNMLVGTYVFQLKATDDTGHEVSDNVQVIVMPIPPNQPPFVVAGTNASIKLPTNSVTLNGLATDGDGTITTLKWTQVNGPVVATLTNDNTLNLTASNLAEGAYTFRLTATDDDGAKGNGEALVFVDAENSTTKKPPVVFAGEDVLINLKGDPAPVDYTMSANALDPDGTINETKWEQFAGPNMEFTSNDTEIKLAPLKRGQFGFRFTATDEDGLSASDDVVVSIIGENDEIPKFFSPNGDGQGEVWVFRNIDDYATCKLRVFSRSGQVVFEASPYANNWDGSFNGKPLSNGDYYYNLICDNGKKLAGAVRIIR